MITPVILCGGEGSNLWPLTKTIGKPFLKINNNISLFQETLIFCNNNYFQKPIIIGNEKHLKQITNQIKEVNISNYTLFIEQLSKNNAISIILALLEIMTNNTSNYMLVLPTDHIIEDKKKFLQEIKKADNLNEEFISFGIEKKNIFKNYGLIKKNSLITNNCFRASKFIEKPPTELAHKLYSTKNYLINTGIYLFNIMSLANKLKIIANDFLDLAKKIYHNANKENSYNLFLSNELQNCPHISIDYLFMEKLDNFVVVMLDNDWEDIGNWHSLSSYYLRNTPPQNILKGKQINCYQSNTNLIFNLEQKKISTLGIDNCIIVNTKEHLFIANRDFLDQWQNVKKD